MTIARPTTSLAHFIPKEWLGRWVHVLDRELEGLAGKQAGFRG